MMNWIKKHSVLFVVIIFNLILIGIVIFVLINQNSKTALLDVMVTPVDSKITLNNQEIKNFETQKFAPGQYTAKIEKEGMETKEIVLNLENNNTTKLYLYLIGVNNDLSYYKTNLQDGDILLKVYDDKIKDFVLDYQSSLNILQKLPIKYANFSQDYTEYREYVIRQSTDQKCNHNAFCLEITDVNGDNYELALQDIRNNGGNPDFFTVFYKYKPIEKI